MQLKDERRHGFRHHRGSTFQLLRVGDASVPQGRRGLLEHQEARAGSRRGRARPPQRKLDGKYVKVPQGDPAYRQLSGFTDKDVLLDGLLTLHGKLDKGDRARPAACAPSRSPATRAPAARWTCPWRARPYPLRLQRAGGAGTLQLTDWGKDVHARRSRRKGTRWTTAGPAADVLRPARAGLPLTSRAARGASSEVGGSAAAGRGDGWSRVVARRRRGQGRPRTVGGDRRSPSAPGAQHPALTGPALRHRLAVRCVQALALELGDGGLPVLGVRRRARRLCAVQTTSRPPLSLLRTVTVAAAAVGEPAAAAARRARRRPGTRRRRATRATGPGPGPAPRTQIRPDFLVASSTRARSSSGLSRSRRRGVAGAAGGA